MKFIALIVLTIILVAALTQIYFMVKERSQLNGQLFDLNDRLSKLSKENDKLKSEIDYFSYPENLEKELKSKFNYLAPGEKMMIIVP